MGINEFIKIGDKIKSFRKSLKLTQDEMAKKLSIPRSTYANYESNKREPNSEIIYKICNIFDISPYELIGENTLIEDSIDGTVSSDSVISDMFLENFDKFTSKPSELKEQQEWIAQQDVLYKSFITFITSKALEQELNYTENEISEYKVDIFKFILEMLDMKINEIKYKNIIEKDNS